MTLARRAPLLARWLVGAAVTAERLRPGIAYQGLLRALPPADRRVATEPRVRESLADSYTLAFRQGVRGQVHDWGIIGSPWGFRRRTSAFRCIYTTAHLTIGCHCIMRVISRREYLTAT